VTAQSEPQAPVIPGLAGRVAFIPGAARGQGRSHAVALARAGADIIATDCCRQLASVPYPMSTSGDLAETAALVEKAGGRCLTAEADVRTASELDRAVAAGLEQFGRIDIVVANAGIAQGFREDEQLTPQRLWADYIDVNLTGVWNTIQATMHAVIAGGRGGSVILINSTSGLKGMSRGDPRSDAYTAAKHGGVGLMRAYATELGPHGIRVNAIHPTAVNTPMVNNDAMAAWIERNKARVATGFRDALNAGLLQPADISDAVVWLASDTSRYVTGVSLPVDAGFTVI
jgi:SDR family mycofactocin-dependent oxidoreductase